MTEKSLTSQQMSCARRAGCLHIYHCQSFGCTHGPNVCELCEANRVVDQLVNERNSSMSIMHERTTGEPETAETAARQPDKCCWRVAGLPVDTTPELCPNCGKDEVGTFTADDWFLYGREQFRLLAKDVLFFRCMVCSLEYTGEDGERKRMEAVRAHLARQSAQEISEDRESPPSADDARRPSGLFQQNWNLVDSSTGGHLATENNKHVKCQCPKPVISSMSGSALCGICRRSLRNWKGKGGRYEPGPPNDPDSEDPRMARVRTLMREHTPIDEIRDLSPSKRVEAAKLYREIHGCTLEEAIYACHAIRMTMSND